jgi:hypothetical protein
LCWKEIAVKVLGKLSLHSHG